eukprot:Pgem_evm1s9604
MISLTQERAQYGMSGIDNKDNNNNTILNNSNSNTAAGKDNKRNKVNFIKSTGIRVDEYSINKPKRQLKYSSESPGSSYDQDSINSDIHGDEVDHSVLDGCDTDEDMEEFAFLASQIDLNSDITDSDLCNSSVDSININENTYDNININHIKNSFDNTQLGNFFINIESASGDIVRKKQSKPQQRKRSKDSCLSFSELSDAIPEDSFRQDPLNFETLALNLPEDLFKNRPSDTKKRYSHGNPQTTNSLPKPSNNNRIKSHSSIGISSSYYQNQNQKNTGKKQEKRFSLLMTKRMFKPKSGDNVVKRSFTAKNNNNKEMPGFGVDCEKSLSESSAENKRKKVSAT